MWTVSERAALNIESVVAFILMLVIVLRSRTGTRDRCEIPTSRKWCAVALMSVAMVVIAAYWPSLWDPLLSDDWILIRTSAAPGDLLGTVTRPGGDGAMRPLGNLVFGVYKHWAGAEPLRWHVLDLFLHILNVVALYWLCRRLWGSSVTAILAAAIFGLHGAHPEAMAWTSSTFDLLATLFTLLTLLAITGERREAAFVAGMLTAFAILSKESAYCLPLVATLLFAAQGKMSRARLWAIGSCTAMSIALLALRWHVFHGPGGYVDAATGHAQILGVTSLSAVKALVYRPWAILLAPLNLSNAPGIWTSGFLVLFGIAIIYLAFRSPCPRRTSYLLLACTIAALIPPLHLALIPADLLGTRVFYLATVFVSLWLASEIGALTRKTGVIFVGASVACFHLFALHHNLGVRSGIAAIGGRACESAKSALMLQDDGRDLTVQGLPGRLNGIFFFANGFQECVASRVGGGRIHMEVAPLSGIPDERDILRWDNISRSLIRVNQ